MFMTYMMKVRECSNDGYSDLLNCKNACFNYCKFDREDALPGCTNDGIHY